jgi:AAA+ ATPase superfamily predicted ATPase
MKFVNRRKELDRLKRLFRFGSAGLAVIWGRRRLGKTRLLLEWTGKNGGVYFVADESSPAIQRKFLALAIEQALPGFSEAEYPDWQSLFLRLARDALQAKWKGPIVIDELPYLISGSPELSSILQKFIDHDAKKAKLVVVLCGSSQRMMQSAILNESAPLYGRADEIIKLHPIAIGYMKEALKLKTPRNIVESYAIWGGVPRYWELVSKVGGNLYETIDRLVLDPMGPLNEEPQRLLYEESPPAIHLRPILDAIGLGANRLSEVASRMESLATTLGRSIERLIELELIQREVPYGTDPQNSKKTLYKIKDPFLRFWFKIVASKRSLFSQVSTFVRHQWLKEGLPGLFAISWEELCRSAVPILSENWEAIYEPAGRFWQGQGPEWDILSQSLDHRHFLIGEAKWTEKKPSVQWIYKTIQELKSKGIPPVKRHPEAILHYVLFIPEKPKGLMLPPDVRIVEAKDVISVLY